MTRRCCIISSTTRHCEDLLFSRVDILAWRVIAISFLPRGAVDRIDPFYLGDRRDPADAVAAAHDKRGRHVVRRQPDRRTRCRALLRARRVVVVVAAAGAAVAPEAGAQREPDFPQLGVREPEGRHHVIASGTNIAP